MFILHAPVARYEWTRTFDGSPCTSMQQSKYQCRGCASIIPLLHKGEKPLKHDDFRCSSRLGQMSPAPASITAPWTYFRVAKSSLVELKSKASTNTNSNVEWVSTNDALTAFIWQRVGIPRSRRFNQGTPMFCDRLVNVRRRLQPPVPVGHMGHMLILDQIALTFPELESSSLSAIASRLRPSLNTI